VLSHCRVCHHFAVGLGWQPLYRLSVILDLDLINHVDRLVITGYKPACSCDLDTIWDTVNRW